MINLIGTVVTGFLVGLLARAFYWGDNNMGFWMTSLLGIGGALVVGLVSSWSTGESLREGFNRAGCIGSVVGAMVLIFIGRMLGWNF